MNGINSISAAEVWRIVKPDTVRRVIDIGCHRGEHIQKTLRNRFRNAEILGVEPKESNFRECVSLDLKGVEFAQLDCRCLTKDAIGTFDFVWCFGLIYHLDDPTLLIKSLRSITTDESFVWIEGHIAIETEQAMMEDPNPPIVRTLLDGEPYYGKRYIEFTPDITSAQKDVADRASLDNETAIWLTYDSLIRMFRRYGFATIWETVGRTMGSGIFLGDKKSYLKDRKREWSRRGFLLSKKPTS